MSPAMGCRIDVAAGLNSPCWHLKNFS